MLKWVSKDASVQVPRLQECIESLPRGSFACDIQLKAPYLYIMTGQDPSHYLECDLVLEIEESRDEKGPNRVICHFPKISGKALRAFVGGDDLLYGIVMIQFEMKILQRLLLFCMTHHASRLAIYPDDAKAGDLEIYRQFLAYGGYSPSPLCLPDKNQAEMTFSASLKAYDTYCRFMSQATLKLQQALWQNQRSNPAVREYLKLHPFGKVPPNP